MNAKEKLALFVIKQNDIRFLVNYFINTSYIKTYIPIFYYFFLYKAVCSAVLNMTFLRMKLVYEYEK